jgi:hypothetical protein
MSPDILKRIQEDFGEQGAAVQELLKPLIDDGYSERIIRCIIHLSGCNVRSVMHYCDAAVRDWRDIIAWAEYDANSRIHDFNQPFGFSDL